MIGRSTCNYQVGCAIADPHGRIVSWGWNSSGRTGYGLHAEAHAILRANRSRLRGATMYVASRRRQSGNVIYSKPCLGCQILIQGAGISRVYWREKDSVWHLWTP